MKFVLATRNAHKATELKRILEELHLDCELLTVADFPDAPEVEETETTFEGNALLKARALAKFTGLAAIADDSGICVDALDGNPGVLSARWSGATENVDQANLDLVLEQIKDIPKESRGAKASTLMPRCSAIRTYSMPSAMVYANSWTAVAPASCM